MNNPLPNIEFPPPFANIAPAQCEKQEVREEPEHEDDDPKELEEAMEKHFHRNASSHSGNAHVHVSKESEGIQGDEKGDHNQDDRYHGLEGLRKRQVRVYQPAHHAENANQDNQADDAHGILDPKECFRLLRTDLCGIRRNRADPRRDDSVSILADPHRSLIDSDEQIMIRLKRPSQFSLR